MAAAAVQSAGRHHHSHRHGSGLSSASLGGDRSQDPTSPGLPGLATRGSFHGMDVSPAFNEALQDVARCAAAEVKKLREDNLRLKQLLEQAQNGIFPPQPEAEPIIEICQTPQPDLQKCDTARQSVCSTDSMMDPNAPGNKVTHKLDQDALAIKTLYKQRSQRIEEYDTTQQYYDTGCFQWVARTSAFEYTTLSVVVLNGFWIAIDVDLNTGGGELIWTIMDNFFCFYFTVELTIRFGAFAKKYRVFCDRWFMFDLCLVAMMVVETWVMPCYAWISGTTQAGGGNAQVLRLLRLMRLSRMAKMMRSVPELMILIKGTVVGIRSVIITLVLLGGITFVFAIAMRTLTDSTEVGNENFSSVPASAYTLLIQGVIPDNGDLMSALGDTTWYYGVLFFVYIFLAALTFMNMLIGILCDAVHSVSCEEKEDMDIEKLRETLQRLFTAQKYFQDTAMVTKHMFVEVMEQDKDIWECLGKLDVDIPSLSDNITGIFDMKEGAVMEFDDFVESILKFRATDESMIKGIFDLQTLLHDHFTAVHKEISSINFQIATTGCSRPAISHDLIRRSCTDHISDHSEEPMSLNDSVMIELQKLENMLEPVSQAVKAMQSDVPSLSERIQRPKPLPNGREPSSSEGAAAILAQSQKTREAKLPSDTMQSRQVSLANSMTTTTQTDESAPQEQQLQSRAPEEQPLTSKAHPQTCSGVTLNNGVQPACIGATTGLVPPAEPSKLTASVAQKTQENTPLLDAQAEETNAHENGQSRTIGNHQIQPAQKTAQKPEDHGDTVSEIVYHRALFGEQVSSLKFRVSWDGAQPMVVNVIPGGEAERQGLWAGDILTEINGTITLGRPRDELLPLLAVRPLLVIAERRHERTPV